MAPIKLHSSFEKILLEERDRLFLPTSCDAWLPMLRDLALQGIHKRSSVALMVALSAIDRWYKDKSQDRRNLYLELRKLSRRKDSPAKIEKLKAECHAVSNDGVTSLEARLVLSCVTANYRGWVSDPDFKLLVPLLSFGRLGRLLPADDDRISHYFHKIRLRLHRMSRENGYAALMKTGEREFNRVIYLTFKTRAEKWLPELGREVPVPAHTKTGMMHTAHVNRMASERRKRAR